MKNFQQNQYKVFHWKTLTRSKFVGKQPVGLPLKSIVKFEIPGGNIFRKSITSDTETNKKSNASWYELQQNSNDSKNELINI